MLSELVCCVNLICGGIDEILAEIMDEVVGIRGIDQKVGMAQLENVV